MATQYTDLYYRHYIGDPGQYPDTNSALSASPDIIPWGLAPQNDPQTFFSANYAQDVGQNVIANSQNFLYARCKNLSAASSSGQMYLYYSPASLLLWPNIWSTNVLKTASGAGFYQTPSVASGAISVTTDPYLWTPSLPNPGDHYCLISRVVTAANPNPIPNPGDLDSFASYVSNHPNIGWRNVSVITTGAPTFQIPVGYNQGPEGGNMKVLLTCTNVPAGAQVAFSAGAPGPTPVINLPQTTVTNPASFVVGVDSNIPANWNGTITYSYWANGTTPPPGWNIALSVNFPVAPTSVHYRYALSAEELGIDDELAEALNIGPTRLVVMGAYNAQGETPTAGLNIDARVRTTRKR